MNQIIIFYFVDSGDTPETRHKEGYVLQWPVLSLNLTSYDVKYRGFNHWLEICFQILKKNI